MTSSRDRILNKLRAARQPFPDAPPRPKDYVPVTRLDGDTPAVLRKRFAAELERLNGEVFVVRSDAAARDQVIDLLKAHDARSILAWDFEHLPVKDLEQALAEAGIEVHHPAIHDDGRDEALQRYAAVPVGLTGVDAAIATTGTLVVSAAPGKGRIPTILPPVHIVLLRQRQIVPRLEDWVAKQRSRKLRDIRQSPNWCFISGPSRTADIEKNLVLGMHGPEQLQVIVKV
jgi:L-lactate dehydrogenase complex protein LldG